MAAPLFLLVLNAATNRATAKVERSTRAGDTETRPNPFTRTYRLDPREITSRAPTLFAYPSRISSRRLFVVPFVLVRFPRVKRKKKKKKRRSWTSPIRNPTTLPDYPHRARDRTPEGSRRSPIGQKSPPSFANFDLHIAVVRATDSTNYVRVTPECPRAGANHRSGGGSKRLKKYSARKVGGWVSREDSRKRVSRNGKVLLSASNCARSIAPR